MSSDQSAGKIRPLGAAAQCRNCGEALSGRFCSNCGQSADIHVPSTLELIHDALEGITHSDSRLWRTLYLLWFKPGRLTQEFVAGRRMAYLPPFRLYLVVSVIFFLIASFSHPTHDVVNFDDAAAKSAPGESPCGDFHFTTGGQDWGARVRHACTEIARDKGRNLLHVAVATMPKAMFIFLPLVAFLHMLMYWWPRSRYAEHLLFFLHVHAFFFSLMTLVVLSADVANTWPNLEKVWRYGILLPWFMPLYTVLAMKRVFARSWKLTLFKAFALFVVYMVVLLITLAGVFLYAVLQL